MRKAIIAACCVALLGGVSAASAQTTGQPGQDGMKMNNPMNAQAHMKKHHKKMKKGMMKSGSDMSGMKKDDSGMKKDDMGGMKK